MTCNSSSIALGRPSMSEVPPTMITGSLLSNGVAGSHSHILGLISHGKAVDQALSAEDYAVAVHGHFPVVSLQGQFAQFGDVDSQAAGGELQEPAGCTSAYSAHGKAPGNSVLDRYGLVVVAGPL